MGRAPASPELTTFIIRRLFAAVLVLIVVSIATFAVFFLIPRLAGQTSYQLAAQYVGRNPVPAQIHDTEIKLGLNQPLQVQYWQVRHGHHLRARPIPTAQARRTALCHVLGTPDVQQPVWLLLTSNIPVTLSLAAGAAVIWLVSGVAVGVLFESWRAAHSSTGSP